MPSDVIRHGRPVAIKYYVVEAQKFYPGRYLRVLAAHLPSERVLHPFHLVADEAGPLSNVKALQQRSPKRAVIQSDFRSRCPSAYLAKTYSFPHTHPLQISRAIIGASDSLQPSFFPGFKDIMFHQSCQWLVLPSKDNSARFV